ncbi:MAG: hypothetical protein LBQ24_04030 [Candidatus Peribacteria bacterium]|nr:hypothetical protein [Candidatus Peribacteria bacterium]
MRTVVSQSPEFAKDIEFKTRIENLSSLVQAKLQTTDMKGIRPIDN